MLQPVVVNIDMHRIYCLIELFGVVDVIDEDVLRVAARLRRPPTGVVLGTRAAGGGMFGAGDWPTAADIGRAVGWTLAGICGGMLETPGGEVEAPAGGGATAAAVELDSGTPSVEFKLRLQ